MRYAKLDRTNAIKEFLELTAAEYDALPAVDRAELYEASDPTITLEYVFEDRWYSPEEIRDREYAADPVTYKAKYTDEVNVWRAAWFRAGFVYEGNTFKGEANDQLWMNAFLELLSIGIATPPVRWITMDNSVIEFATIEEFQALAAFFFNWAQDITFQCLQIKAAIRDATSRADVDAVYEPFVAARMADGLTI